MKIIRVFPRRTNQTPTDEDAYIGYPTLFSKADKINISVTFTWDLKYAEELAKQWEQIAPVEIGGVATGAKGGEFEVGMYLKKGNVITSRGCPNRCWFCSVWKREGNVMRELEIKQGWNVQDDNLLACSERHIRGVFKMLKNNNKTREQRVMFNGGFEAARLKDWHIDLLVDLKPHQVFFAYDTPDSYEPLVEAGKRLKETRLNNGRTLRSYVLIGHPKDTFEKAERRLRESWSAGFLPMAMLWRNDKGEMDREWRKFQILWSMPATIIKLLENPKGGL